VEALPICAASPTWMWRNTVVVEFVELLRAHNDALPPGAKIRLFIGLDPLQPATLDEKPCCE